MSSAVLSRELACQQHMGAQARVWCCLALGVYRVELDEVPVYARQRTAPSASADKAF